MTGAIGAPWSSFVERGITNIALVLREYEPGENLPRVVRCLVAGGWVDDVGAGSLSSPTPLAPPPLGRVSASGEQQQPRRDRILVN